MTLIADGSILSLAVQITGLTFVEFVKTTTTTQGSPHFVPPETTADVSESYQQRSSEEGSYNRSADGGSDRSSGGFDRSGGGGESSNLDREAQNRSRGDFSSQRFQNFQPGGFDRSGGGGFGGDRFGGGGFGGGGRFGGFGGGGGGFRGRR